MSFLKGKSYSFLKKRGLDLQGEMLFKIKSVCLKIQILVKTQIPIFYRISDTTPP